MVNFFKVISHSSRDVIGICFSLGSLRSFAEQNHLHRLEEDGYVQRNGEVLDVEEIQLQLSFGVFHACAIAIFDLRPTRESRTHSMALSEERQAGFQHFAEVGLFRARTNQAHFSMQNVEELRQLVQPVTANDCADASDPAVAVGGPTWAALLRILAHGSKFQNLKMGAVQTGSLLLKEH